MADDILQKIIKHKLHEISERKLSISLPEIKQQTTQTKPVRDYVAAIEKAIVDGKPAVIAEIKKASPSKGVIREYFKPAAIAADYHKHGASCLSVLTDQVFFQGHDSYIGHARQACDLPVLRKDFIIDAYQVYESKVLGADAVLLIVAALDDTSLHALAKLAAELELDVLVEVHDADELARALTLPCRLIGINNRNLHTFKTNLSTTLDLLAKIPDGRIVVTESGINHRKDIELMRANGVNAFLVGEAFMRAESPGQALADLFGN